MKINQFTRFAVLCTLATATPCAFAQDETATAEKTVKTETTIETKVEKGPVIEKGSLTNVINDSVTFSTLKKALVAAELDVTLGSKGAYTIFAPTDEAFDKLPAGLLGKLMLPENKEKLRSLLLYHVIAGNMPASTLKDGDVKTMNGEKIKIDVDGDKIEVDEAKVFSADVPATNGVMHSVGKVLIPKSLKDFSPLD
ncbi:fasciclin domain-containing protein [Luteolibacter yonseiensis]|uniref:Fasciclin domain-containing protein n=1 Tax=Luteolibacter yonseiensis TaxID=1144680 RepID=A0A934VCK1_9BACT|nr:fasciclin domain-containing protein [Luteolibacter yonseiensis]MBK1817056.1 fasciclin domain-containing protein [Luteolibacter yonseiensis]